jgi:hypothetical protein
VWNIACRPEIRRTLTDFQSDPEGRSPLEDLSADGMILNTEVKQV